MEYKVINKMLRIWPQKCHGGTQEGQVGGVLLCNIDFSHSPWGPFPWVYRVNMTKRALLQNAALVRQQKRHR